MMSLGRSAYRAGCPWTIYPTASQFCDSVDTATLSINGYSTPRPNALSSLHLQLQPGCSRLSVAINHNTSYVDGTVGIVVDGVFSAIAISGPLLSMWITDVALDPSIGHTIELRNGYVEYGTGGVFIYAISGDGGYPAVLPNPSVSRRLVVFGDSIATGVYATPISQYGYVNRLRAVYPGRISLQGWGGGKYADFTGLADANALAQRFVDLCFNATTREVWDAMGYNDFGGHTTPTSLATIVGATYDAVHAIDPTVHIWSMTPLITGGTPNAWGEYISEYRTAKASATVGRSWVTLVDGTALLSAGGLQDGVHPSTAGHGVLATNIATVLGM